MVFWYNLDVCKMIIRSLLDHIKNLAFCFQQEPAKASSAETVKQPIEIHVIKIAMINLYKSPKGETEVEATYPTA